MPITIAALTAAGISAGSAIYNTVEANKLAKNRPKYQINTEYQINKDLARNQAQGTNVQFQNARDEARESAANMALQGQKASNNSMTAISNANNAQANLNANLRGIAGQEAQFKANALGQEMNANIGMAEEKDKAWNYNTNQPYQEEVKERKLRRQQARQDLNDIPKAIGLMKGKGGGGKKTPTTGTTGADGEMDLSGLMGGDMSGGADFAQMAMLLA